LMARALNKITLQFSHILDFISRNGKLDRTAVFYLAPFKKGIDIQNTFTLLVDIHF
jgi:hypothetical protein